MSSESTHVHASWTCPECGWTNRGGRFCFECGRDGDPDQIIEQHLLPEPDEDEPRWPRLALIGGALALLLAVVVGAVVLLSGGDSPTAEAPVPKAASKLDRAQTIDELMKIVIASRAGLAAAGKGEWAEAAANRTRLVGRVERLAARTDEIEAARTGLARALVASEQADNKSLACKDKVAVSACATPAHRRATTLKERFRSTFNKILRAEGREPVAPNSF